MQGVRLQALGTGLQVSSPKERPKGIVMTEPGPLNCQKDS